MTSVSISGYSQWCQCEGRGYCFPKVSIPKNSSEPLLKVSFQALEILKAWSGALDSAF